MEDRFPNEDRRFHDGELFSPHAQETSAFSPPYDPRHNERLMAHFQSHHAGWRRAMLRRLAALLCTGAAAFTLTTWALVQRERHRPAAFVVLPDARSESGEKGQPASPGQTPGQNANAAATAREQLDLLSRGEVSSAYEIFSPAYRAKVPLEAFRALVSSHRALFRTEEEEMDSAIIGPDRTRVDLHVQSEDQERYIAHFILARIDGRWFVDDLRWVNADDEDEDLTSA